MANVSCVIIILICMTVPVDIVVGFPGGADSEACTSMVPTHGASGQTSASPYQVVQSTTTLAASGSVTVTITGSNFKGFLLQAREVGSSTAIGTWSGLPSGTKKMCTDTAVTHTADGSKSDLEFVWTAPASLPSGNVEFFATVVQTKTTFWVKVASSPLSQASGGSPTPAPGSPTPAPAPTTTPAPGPSTTPAPQPDISIDLSNCGSTKSCMRSPDNCAVDMCNYVVTWEATGSVVNFEVSGRTDGYVTLGLSADQKMAGTSVTACVVQTSGVVKVSQYYNPGYTSQPVTPNDQLGLSGTVGSYRNNYITCTFARDTAISPANSEVTDLDKDLYLIVAMGSTTSGLVAYHDSTPEVSSQSVNPASGELTTLGGGAAVSRLEQTHGVLMLSAWMFCASVGIILARYYKGAWAESTLCGVKVWFALHRGLMISNLALTLTAFVVIFVDAKRWSQWGVSYQDAHPYLGVLVAGLVIINPLMALCRPHPGEPRRPIFNWAHWGVGTAAHIIAIVNIFIGMNLPSAKGFTPSAATWVMVAFVVIHVIVEIVLELEKCQRGKGAQEMEMTAGDQGQAGGDPPESTLLKPIIIVYMILAAILWLTIVILMIA